jgi:hypothetical protein
MTDTPYDPSQLLRVDATDEHLRDRLAYVLEHDSGWSGEAPPLLAREFAAACVAAERATIKQNIRSLPCWQPNIADGGRSMVTEKSGGWLCRAHVIESLLERNELLRRNTMKTDPKLLPPSVARPCPFCAQNAEIQPWHGGGKNKRRVGCSNEFCEAAPSVTASSRARAIGKWNADGK